MAAPSRNDRDAIALFGALASVAAFLVATLAVIVAVVAEPAGGSGGGDGGGGQGASGPTTVAVSLTEFAITPNTINAPAGEISLDVVNDGSMAHNLQVVELDLITADLNAGDSETLDLGTVEPGTYKVICAIPGHEAAGMVATLVVSESEGGGESGGGSSSGSGGGGESSTAGHDFAATEQAQAERLAAYLDGAATAGTGVPTEGRGNQPLEARVGPDGAKEFELTAEVIEWEVEPGKVVEGWAYNGQIPGPWIRVEPGDLVRVTFTNNLPGAGTDVHFHGITTNFGSDGVSPLTQPLVPGDGGTFVHEFRVPDRSELGMYHAHMHGQEALPNGMYGVFQVGDVQLPRGETVSGITVPADLEVDQELQMVLNDAGTIGLSLNGKAYPATDPIITTSGDNVLLTYHNQGLQIHPMHLHHLPQLVVAKDGFALEQPYWADTVNVAPGERYTVLILTSRNDTRLDVDGNVLGEGLDGAGIWAFHCHILTHAESDQGLFGMVTAFVVLPTGADIAANPDGPPAPAAEGDVDAGAGESADPGGGGDGT